MLVAACPAAAAEIFRSTGNSAVEMLPLELGDLKSVRAFVSDFGKKYGWVDQVSPLQMHGFVYFCFVSLCFYSSSMLARLIPGVASLALQSSISRKT